MNQDDLIGKPEECVITVRGVSVQLRRQFKMLCAANDITIQDRIIELMQADVDGKGEGDEAK